ncbi:MAG: GntR family transcriptional regulator [Victivallaceae bacterium]|nr:GntR family transcriptional regulator [Victivallaceae bacterium]
MRENPDKTNALRNALFSAILQGVYPPGCRLPSERDLAEQQSVSRITVRRAIEELVHSDVLCRKQGCGTFVSERCRANADAGKLVALLSSVDEAFALDFVRSFEREVVRSGRLLVLRLTDDDPESEEHAAIELAAAGVRNLVLWASGKDFREETFRRLRVLGVNLVLFDRVLPRGSYADYVGVDNADAVRSLFDRVPGIRRAVFLAHPSSRYDTDTLREGAFRLECSKRRIHGEVIPVDASSGVDSSLWADADAIFCVNDSLAEKILPFAGGKPLFGIDGLSRKFPTYVQPMAQMARRVVDLLERQQSLGERWKEQQIFMKGISRDKQQ